MNKRKLHHQMTVLRTVPLLLFLGLALFFGALSVVALRANNQKMIELREAVYKADREDGDIEGALKELRQHVYAHMNTDLAAGNAIRPPIQLEHTYERLVQAEQSKLRSTNASLYDAATRHCESIYGPGQIIPRAQCTAEYVEQRGVQAPVVPEDLYKFDFASPRWSPDLAGWSLVLAAVSLLLFIIRAGSYTLIRRQLKQ